MSVSTSPLPTNPRRDPLPSPSGGNLERRRRRTGLFLVIPALVVMAGVILYPIARSILLSFQEAKLSAGAIGTARAGWENYRRISENETFTLAPRNSAFFTVSEVLLVLAIALGVALLLNTKAGRNPVYTTILLVPWVIAPVANAVLWKWILHANYGAQNALLAGLGITDRYVNLLGTPGLALRMLLLADVWKSAPFITLILLAGLQNIPAALYDFGYGAAIANIIFLIMFVLALVFITLLKPGAPRSQSKARV